MKRQIPQNLSSKINLQVNRKQKEMTTYWRNKDTPKSRNGIFDKRNKIIFSGLKSQVTLNIYVPN